MSRKQLRYKYLRVLLCKIQPNKKMGRQYGQGRNGGSGQVVHSRQQKANESWIREANLSGVKEIQLKFTVRGDMIPYGCPLIPVVKQELDKRALRHEVARGDQFIKNAEAVNAAGVGDQLVAAGFVLAGFSHHWKKTLHSGDQKAIVECRFSTSEKIFFDWKDSLVGECLKYSWFVHAYNNTGGIMTINMVHPQRRRCEKTVQIESGKISLVSV